MDNATFHDGSSSFVYRTRMCLASLYMIYRDRLCATTRGAFQREQTGTPARTRPTRLEELHRFDPTLRDRLPVDSDFLTGQRDSQ